MIPDLPDDILQLVCDALLAKRDFATLYNCAVSCKRLASCALSDIYRIYNEAADEDEEAEGFQNAAQIELTVQRWAIKWRAITLSALDQSMFPYYRYLRMLDLRDLASLVSDERFRGKVEKMFFSGSMNSFKRERQVQFNPKRPARKILDGAGVVEAIGDAIVPKTDTLEQLSGQFSAEALRKWVTHLPRLQRLELWIGRALMGSDTHAAIHKHCPNFSALSVGHWIDPYDPARSTYDPTEADTQLGLFLSGLPQNSLNFFENIWKYGMSVNSCQGLARFPSSLRELRLCIEKETIPHLLLLRDCTALEKVRFEIASENVDENALAADDLIHLTAWLRDCHALTSIDFSEAMFAPKLLTPVLQSADIALDEFKIHATRYWYSMKDNRAFHAALANQRALTSLSLFGDAGEVVLDDNLALVESVCQCTSLKHLKLRGVSEYFSETMVISVLESLPLLEELYIQGLNLGDAVLDPIASHPNLKSMCFMDLTTFTFEGLLAFVQNLDATKLNFELSISMASNEALLGDEEVQVIRQALFEKVKGKLEYQAFRDALDSDFDGESD